MWFSDEGIVAPSVLAVFCWSKRDVQKLPAWFAEVTVCFGRAVTEPWTTSSTCQAFRKAIKGLIVGTPGAPQGHHFHEQKQTKKVFCPTGTDIAVCMLQA